MARSQTTLTLKQYDDGIRPAPGEYRVDKLVIGEDGWPVEYDGLRPFKEHKRPNPPMNVGKWGRNRQTDKWGRAL